MTRTESIQKLLRSGSYSVQDIRQFVRKPNGTLWSVAAVEASLRQLPVVKDDNLFTIVG